MSALAPTPEAPPTPPSPVARPRRRGTGTTSPLGWPLRILFVVTLAAFAAQLAWGLSGGTDYVIATPSMCPRLCVGSLALDRPLTAPVRVGMTLTFQPPGNPETYTHEVVRLLPHGRFLTRGAGAFNVDPWTLTAADVKARVVASVWGLGWLLEALKFLVLGLLATILARRYVPRSWRAEFDTLATTLLVAVPVWRLHPLVRAVLVYYDPVAHHHRTHGIAVNTGLFPAQLRVVGGNQVSFVASGHSAHLHGLLSPQGFLRIHELASFHWWGWAIVWFVAASPMLAYLARRWRAARRARAGAPTPDA